MLSLSRKMIRKTMRGRRYFIALLSFLGLISFMIILPNIHRERSGDELEKGDKEGGDPEQENVEKGEDPADKILKFVQPLTRSLVLPGNDTVLVQPKASKSCQNSGSEQYILFMIISSPENVPRREIIRNVINQHINTWESIVVKSFPQYKIGSAIKTLFFVGQPSELSSSVGSWYTEAENEGDVVLDDLSEAYVKLTIKTLRMLKWTQKHCKNAKYVVKIDDDVYLNVPALLQFLNKFMDKKKESENLIAGFKYSKSKVIYDPKSKWYTPKSLWGGGYFPDFVSGIMYVLGTHAREELYQNALDTKLFHLEDVFLTGIVRTKNHVNIPLVHIPGMHVYWLWTDRLSFPCVFVHKIVVAHSVSANQIECYNKMYDYCGTFTAFTPVIFLCG